jgi:hypothetical protein
VDGSGDSTTIGLEVDAVDGDADGESRGAGMVGAEDAGGFDGEAAVDPPHAATMNARAPAATRIV